MSGDEILKAKVCYDHLGGTLGGRLFSRLVELGWFQQVPGNARTYTLTPKGTEEMLKLGVDITERRKEYVRKKESV